MKIEIQFTKLKEAITVIERIATKHMTLPVLSCVLIEVSKNSALLKATNLDIGVEISIPIKSDGEGTFTLPEQVISSFVSQVQDQNQIVKLESVSGNIQISTSKSKGVIKTVPYEDFPAIPRVSGGQEFKLQSDLLVKGLRSVAYSASISSVKPELSSVYVYHDSDYIVYAATDSFRLAEKKVKTNLTTKLNDVLIPFKNISDIVRILEIMGGEVTVKTSKNLISFEARDIYVASRVIDGVFPDYRQIIPKSYSTEAVVLKQDFLNALKISNIFSDKFNQIHLTVDPKAKLFEIQTKNSDVGENKTIVDAAVSGDRMEINFNYKYLIDCFQAIDADSVTLQLSGVNKPMVIRPVSGDQTFTYLVMPMNR